MLQYFETLSLKLCQVIDQAQERLFKSGRSQNVITTGYRLVSGIFSCFLNRVEHSSNKASNDGDRGKRGMTRVGITNFFVNTVITTLQEPQWDLLLQRSVIRLYAHTACLRGHQNWSGRDASSSNRYIFVFILAKWMFLPSHWGAHHTHDTGYFTSRRRPPSKSE